MDRKCCPRCQTTKPVAAFGARSGGTRPRAWCVDCKRAYDHDRYVEDRESLVAKAAMKNAIIRARNFALLTASKNVPCADCGRHYPSHVMDFDHVRGDKVANVSALAGAGVAIDVLMTEMAKCEVVCANCHRRRTYLRVHGRDAEDEHAPGLEPSRKEPVQLRLPVGGQLPGNVVTTARAVDG